jgi:hypothetical protein
MQHEYFTKIVFWKFPVGQFRFSENDNGRPVPSCLFRVALCHVLPMKQAYFMRMKTPESSPLRYPAALAIVVE